MTSSDSRTDRDHDDVTEMTWCGCGPLDNCLGPTVGNSAEAIVAWVNANGGMAAYCGESANPEHSGPEIKVRTPTGWAYAAPGDTIVKGGEWIGHVGEEFVGVREFTVRRSS